jgi:chromosome segregation ATPase
MDRVEEHLERLERKILEIAGEYRKIRQEKEILINQSVIHQNKIEEQQKEIQQLKIKIETLEQAGNETAGTDAEMVKNRINDLVREIDRCIELINK